MMTCQAERNAANGASQVGCYGHSLIVDPWGEVLAEAGEQEEIIYADLDMKKLEKIRTKLPVLKHRKLLD
jgi:omega-amidase